MASEQPNAGRLPGTWARSADLIAIDGGPFVVSAPGGGFIAVVVDVHRALVTLESPDGQAWTAVNAPSAQACGTADICGMTPSGLAVHGATVVMTGRDETTGVAAVWTSTDARAWTRIRTLPDLHRGELSGLVSTPRGFAAVVNVMGGSGEIGVALGSPDGGSWSVSWLPAKSNASSQPRLSAVVATGTGYAAVGEVSMAATVWGSPDGSTWAAVPLPGAKDMGFGGGLVVRGGEIWSFVPVDIWQSAEANASRWVSTDGGVTWTAGGPGPRFNLLNGVLSLDGGLVAIGRPATSGATGGGPIWTSADGATWTTAVIGGVPSRPNDGVGSLAASNGHLVAAGWTDIDKGTATGDEALAIGRLVFWAGDVAAAPTLAPAPTPPASQPTVSLSPGPATSPTPQPMPHLAPDAEALLPARVGDTPYAIGSLLMPVETDVSGGDMCFLFCPGEVGGWARKLGVASGLAAIAYATPERSDGETAAVIFALRLPTASGAAPIADAKLEDAWVATHPNGMAGDKQGLPLTLGGKRVRLVVQSFLSSDLNRYIYAHAGTLYLVGIYTKDGMSDITKPGPVADEVFAALP